MVTQLQFVAVAGFLVWCLASSLCGLLRPDSAGPSTRLMWREHGPTGWSRWREVHFGLTSADRRILDQPEPVLDGNAHAALLDTVLHQDTSAESDRIQFAIVRPRQGEDQPTAVFVSEVHGMQALRS